MKYLSWFTSFSVLIVAIAAFWLAFWNVSGLAADNGLSPGLAKLVPIIVEGTMLALAFTRLEAEVNGRKTGYQVAGIVAFVVLAIGLNIAHSNQTTIGMIIAGLQPVSLLVAFEAFMYQLRHRIADSQQTAVNPLQALLDAAQTSLTELQMANSHLQTSITDMQAENGRMQAALNEAQATNARLFESSKQLQIANRQLQALGKDGRLIVAAIAGEITVQQAVERTGWDTRTVGAYMSRLNGGMEKK